MRYETAGAMVIALLSLLMCLQIPLGSAEAAPMADLYPERSKRTTEDLWNELTEGEGKAENHDHWERIVRRSARGWRDPSYRDDTAHIVDVQEYYRDVLANNWDDAEELARWMRPLNDFGDRAKVQNAEVQAMMEVTKPIPGRYIVMLQSHADDYILDRTIAILQQAHIESEGRIRAEHITPIRNIGHGFTATLNSKTAELMMKHPFLELMEEDIALKRASVPTDDDHVAETQHHHRVLWNLDRLDQHGTKLDGHYTPVGDGRLASIYIIDTGVHYTHHEFEGRAKYAGYDAIDHLTGSHNQGQDCHGHGTHCAGTAAGKTYGVAKKASIFSLRALDCDGRGAVSGIVQAMDHIAKKRAESKSPTVFSLSLGVRESVSLNAAVQRAMDKGVVAVGAAGNQGGDSCDYSPASARVGIAVGATDEHDNTVHFSNAGECTDIYAPGMSIKSATSSCDTCTKTLSGTSMSAPHVAGYMAIILSLHPELTAVQAKEKMITQSTKNAVDLAAISSSLASRTPNRLLFVPQASAQGFDMGSMNVLPYSY